MQPGVKLKETATLLFVIKDGQILLARKKRGIGHGLWNGLGGHVEPGETPVLAALREFKEEVVAEADGVRRVGELEFYIPAEDDFSMRVFVFVASDIVGYPQETDESLPRWFAFDDIPWGKMWMDDRIWLPHVIKGRDVEGSFTMIDGELTKVDLVWQES